MDRFGDKVCCNPTVKLKKQESYPVIDIDKIIPGYKTVTSVESIEYTGQGGAKFQDHDVLFARITPCLENGKMAIADTDGRNGIGSTELFVFRGIDGVSDTDYVYYLLCMKHIRQLAANSMTGASGRQRADLNFIKRIQWDFPDIETQKKITSVLSEYDNLIEVNNKRIKVLEQMAENLYEEWFVRFRFPGHKTAEFENGIPKGWAIKRLGDYGRVETGKTPFMEISEYYGDDYLFIKTPEMHGNVFVIDTEEKLSKLGHLSQPKKLLPPNSIMVTCIGTGGVVAINAEPGHTNQQINSIILDDLQYLEWLFFTCRSMRTTIEMFGATGSTMTNLSKGKFEKLKVIEPSIALIERFHRIAYPMLREIEKLMRANQKLACQRDLLLPRLMSGKLEV